MEPESQSFRNELPWALDRWTTAGLVTSEQAQRILSSETETLGVQPAEASENRMSGLSETLGYLGSIVALGSLIAIFASYWDEMIFAGRVALALATTALVFGAGLAVRRTPQAATQRLAAFLFALTAVGVAASAAIVAFEVLPHDSHFVVLMTTLPALIVAAALWHAHRHVPQHLATYVATCAVVASLLALPDGTLSIGYFTAAFASVGIAWCLFVWADRLHPEWLGYSLGASTILLAAQILVTESPTAAIVIGLGAVAAILTFGSVLRRLSLTAVGIVGALVFSPQAVVRWLGDSLGAAVSVLVIGLLLMAVSVLFARARSASQ